MSPSLMFHSLCLDSQVEGTWAVNIRELDPLRGNNGRKGPFCDAVNKRRFLDCLVVFHCLPHIVCSKGGVQVPVWCWVLSNI
jgi:hypothetical protein